MAGYTFTLQSRKYGPQTFEFCDRGAGTPGALQYRGTACCYGGERTGYAVMVTERNFVTEARKWWRAYVRYCP